MKLCDAVQYQTPLLDDALISSCCDIALWTKTIIKFKSHVLALMVTPVTAARRRPGSAYCGAWRGRGCGHFQDRLAVTVPAAARAWHLEPCHTRYRVLPDIGSPDYTISGHTSMTRYRVFLLTRYRDMSDVTRYRVPISGTHPISGPSHHSITDIVNHIPDIGINIGINSIGCPDIGDMISRYR